MENRKKTKMVFSCLFPFVGKAVYWPRELCDRWSKHRRGTASYHQMCNSLKSPAWYSPGYSHMARNKTGAAVHQQQTTQPAASSLFMSSQKADDSLYSLAGVSQTTTSRGLRLKVPYLPPHYFLLILHYRQVCVSASSIINNHSKLYPQEYH